MKISEDKEVQYEGPHYPASYRGAEQLPNDGDLQKFKFVGVQEVLNDGLELKLRSDEFEGEARAWIKGREGSALGQAHLHGYHRELEEKLKGFPWYEILGHDFSFFDARRLQ